MDALNIRLHRIMLQSINLKHITRITLSCITCVRIDLHHIVLHKIA